MGKSDGRRLVLLAAGSALGALAWRGYSKTPVPVEETGLDEGFQTRVEVFPTEDGATLRLKRYANPGGQPVILAHGYTGNGLEFDLPHRRQNLAIYLAERGYDVWVSSFRGCGRSPYQSEAPDWKHSVDELAAFDAPALIRGVRESTGMSPFWIGHSMGGMVLYMYLQGISMEPGKREVSADSDLAEDRNRALKGGIVIGSPPGLHHGGGDWIAFLSRLPFFQANVRLLIRYMENLDRVSPCIDFGRLGRISTRNPRLGRILATQGPVARALYNVRNVDPDVGYSLLRLASDKVTARMTMQILRLGLDPDFKSFCGRWNYTANMDRITAPILFVTGTLDFAGAENLREQGYERVSSPVKEYRNYAGYGHTDLVMGKRVLEEVYPDILAWMRQVEGQNMAGT